MIQITFLGANGPTDTHDIVPKLFKFPAGECHASFNDSYEFEFYCSMAGSCLITARIQNNDDLMHLIMVTETIRHFNSSILMHVSVPYWPAARQDRRNGFESLGCKVYADIINAQKYNSVSIYDAHSDVAPALINNCINVSPLRFIKNAILDFDPDVLIAPDAGAAKKIKAYNIDLPIEYCGKTRNMETGQLTDFQLYCDTFYERPLIIDDICDGGGTFLALAPIIKGKTACEAIGLYVTHGLFTKGVEVITDVFDKVYCTNSYKGNLIDHDKLTVYGI